MAVGCRVSTVDIPGASGETAASNAVGAEGLEVLGPIPGASHWHAAYVVRVCNDVLLPFEAPDDPLGIHSHQDGVAHIHPFFEASGYEAATLGLFADAVGLGLGEGELTLPGGGTWRDGDLCDGVPGRVFVDKWSGPTPDSDVERIFADPASIRFLADAELYQIAFAPADSPPVVPPTHELLPRISNLTPPPEPWIDVDTAATLDDVRMWSVGDVTNSPCADAQAPERVLQGPVRCFSPDGDAISGRDAVQSARAVELNRRPAVEIRMSTELQEFIGAHFSRTSDPLALAIEVDGDVVTAPLLSRPPLSDRLVVSGGFTTDTARQLAAILGS